MVGVDFTKQNITMMADEEKPFFEQLRILVFLNTTSNHG